MKTKEELEQVNGGVLVPQFDIKTDWTPPIYEVRFNNDPPAL